VGERALLTFNILHAPSDPPPGVDGLIWNLSIALRDEHIEMDENGCCKTCKEVAPCRLTGVARKGLLLAAYRHHW
jgi:hypothetical protein